MELATFKERYPVFTDDLAIQTALDYAALLIRSYNVSGDILPTATALLAAHVLSVPAGEVERAVVSVQSGTEQVDFDRNPQSSDWLSKSSYGLQFMALLGISETTARRFGVISDDHPKAINFKKRRDFNGDPIGVDSYDQQYFE